MYFTHEILNQPRPLINYNLFTSDALLQEVLKIWKADWAFSQMSAYGEYAGSADSFQFGFLANENPPQVKSV